MWCAGVLPVPGTNSALSTPRISLGPAKLAVRTAAWTSDGLFTVRVYGEGCTGGWVPGWGIPGGYRGVLPSRLIGIVRAQPLTYGAHRVPSGTPGPAWALRTPEAPAPHLGPIWARFILKYTKVSHKSGVSLENRHEACHTPYLKNRLEYHDLEFPGFPY